VQQTLAESLLLAGIGSVFGLGLAWMGIRELLVIAPPNLPRLQSTGIDPAVLIFTAGLGFAAAAISGILPAVRAARPDLMHILRGCGRAPGLEGGARLRNMVVVLEIALCFVLLVGSGLMFRSFLALQQIDLGYNPNNLETFQLLGPRGATPQQRALFMHEIHDRLRSLPGVRSVAASSPFPLTGGFYPIRWGTAPALVDPGKFQAVDPQIVLPGYFEAMHTPLIAGRTFTEADNAPDRKLVVVDQLLASKASPLESAVGKRILIRIRTPAPEWVQIIGVVAHQRTTSLAEPGREEIFFTDGFLGHGVATQWAVRTSGEPASYAEEIRKEVAKIGPRLLITRMQPMRAWVTQARSGTRFSLLLIGTFAVIAALLAGVGLYGVLSSAVRQRTAEIGVRMAMGATPAKVFLVIVGNGLRLSAVGLAIGIAAALALTRLMISLLVGVRPSDPLTMFVMSILFLAIATIASWLPARRASALDPAAALREE
jgi:putative ABC transport system permease protein